MPAAVFLDLDRTLLKGASGPLIGQALATAGVVSRTLPGQGAVYKVFDVIGETLPSMALARAAAFVAKGWSADAVREAGKQAAVLLDDLVAPFARSLIADHQAAGRPVVLATTTPYDLVKPLADQLGVDDVIATRYEEADGFYTGKLAGEFVWATGKLAAVRRWAAGAGVDLDESYAYSDSFYDLPLLGAVGHPTAVNPDPRLRVVATIRRWPVVHLDVPPGVPKLVGVEPFDALRPFTSPLAFPYARFDIEGADRIPASGPAIVVGNHRSYFDVAAFGMLFAKVGRPPRFLGKKEVFDAPVVGSLARAFGGIRVDRGTGSGEPLKEAARAIEAGEVVTLMPQGTIPRGPAFFDPVLKGKSGAARLAAMTGAPVIPVGLWGTERVWPRSSRVPHVWNVWDPPTIRIRVGSPVALTHEQAADDTRRIMDAVVDLLPSEARRRRIPSAEELARTYPPGKAEGTLQE